MLKGKKIVVVMPAYNAAKTVRQTYAEIPHDIVDEIILVDFFSLYFTPFSFPLLFYLCSVFSPSLWKGFIFKQLF